MAGESFFMELQPVYEKEMPPFLEGHAAPRSIYSSRAVSFKINSFLR